MADGDFWDMVLVRATDGGDPVVVLRGSQPELIAPGTPALGISVKNAQNQIVARLGRKAVPQPAGPSGLVSTSEQPPAAGYFVLNNDEGEERILVDGATGHVRLGGSDVDGKLIIDSATNQLRFQFDGASGDARIGGNGVDGDVKVFNDKNRSIIFLNGGDGDTIAADTEDGVRVLALNNKASSGTIKYTGEGAPPERPDPGGIKVGLFVGGWAKREDPAAKRPGLVHVRDSHGDGGVWLSGHGLGSDPTDDRIALDHQGHRRFSVRHDGTLWLGPADSHEGDCIAVDNQKGKRLLAFHESAAYNGTRAGLFIGQHSSQLDTDKTGNKLPGRSGLIVLRDAMGNDSVILDGLAGDIHLQPADCAEDFDVTADDVDSGTVMVITDGGTLQVSSRAYDTRVAGVVSGGGQYRPGIVLDGMRPGLRRPISLVGKVYCKVDATNEPIVVGSLLTTSPTPGHAMCASDPKRAFGAVLGKALASLPEGNGMIPILVTLQ